MKLKSLFAVSVFFIICLLSSNAFASDSDNESAISNELDMTAEVAMVEEYGIPTKESIQEMKETADQLYGAKNYEKAAEAFLTYAEHVNYYANLISQGLEPFYSNRDSDKHLNWDDPFLGQGADFERLANSYKEERNRATTYAGVCYAELGKYDLALSTLYKALELIEIDQDEYWVIAAQTLYDIIGVDYQ